MSGRPIGQFLTVATPSGRLLAAMTVCECGGRPMGLISGLSDGGPAGGVGEGGGALATAKRTSGAVVVNAK